MPEPAESNLKMPTLMPWLSAWLLAIVVHVALVLVAITIFWCTLPDGNGEQGDRIVPTITLVEATRGRGHFGGGCGPFGGTRGTRGRAFGTGCHRPNVSGDRRSLIKPVSLADSLAISDTWGTNVDLPADVTQPFRTGVLFPPSGSGRTGVISCSFGCGPQLGETGTSVESLPAVDKTGR